MVDLAYLQTAYQLVPPLTLFALPAGINNSIVGLHTGAGDFVIKTRYVRHDPALLRYEQALVQWLAQQELSFAVPPPLITQNGDGWVPTASGDSNGPVQLLLPRLPGTRPDWRDPSQIELVGGALAELHRALAHYPSSSHPALVSYGDLAQIHPAMPAPDNLTRTALGLPLSTAHEIALAWWRAELAALHTFINGPYRLLPWQVIHSDFGHSNTLYQNECRRISAILDFEFAGPEARAMDLAAGLYFCMRIWENPQPLDNAVAFCRGYRRRQSLTHAEIEAIPWLMRLRNVTSTIWWFGRQLTAGVSVDLVARIAELRQLVTWLAGTEGEAFTRILTTLHD